jgi:hypothetical protein
LFIGLYSAVEVKDTVDRKTRTKIAEPVYVSGAAPAGSGTTLNRWRGELSKTELNDRAR